MKKKFRRIRFMSLIKKYLKNEETGRRNQQFHYTQDEFTAFLSIPQIFPKMLTQNIHSNTCQLKHRKLKIHIQTVSHSIAYSKKSGGSTL